MIQFFISDALAQSSESATQSQFSPASFVPLILIFVIFYFLIIRPQTKKIKDHEKMVNGLKIGNKVITSSGIVGIIREIHEKENQVGVEIAEGVVITMLKNNVSEIEKPVNHDKKSSKHSDKHSEKHSDKKHSKKH
jgi:preprotein translocase subunit YajC